MCKFDVILPPFMDVLNDFVLILILISGEGEFSCLNCERKYKLKSSLRRHIKYECQTERKFRCQFCGSSFKLNHHLKEHIIHKHPDEFLEASKKKLM